MIKMPLFGTSKKSPAEVVRNLRETFQTLEKGADTRKQEKVGFFGYNTYLKNSYRGGTHYSFVSASLVRHNIYNAQRFDF